MTTGGLPPQTHSDDLTLLHTALDGVLATDLDCCSVAELLDRACTLQTLSARIDAARAVVLAAADSATDAPGVLRRWPSSNGSCSMNDPGSSTCRSKPEDSPTG